MLSDQSNNLFSLVQGHGRLKEQKILELEALKDLKVWNIFGVFREN